MPRVPDLLARDYGAIAYVLSPYLWAGGITLLHGKTSVGKSPLSWSMAQAVASGTPWLDHPVTPGPVLYVESDTAAGPVGEMMLQPRLRHVPSPHPDWWLECVGSFNICFPGDPVRYALAKRAAEVKPALVILNTLREIHTGDDIKSQTPQAVYRALREVFGPVALLVIHHDHKVPHEGSQRDPRESFAGSAAWLNHAQVGLHLVQAGTDDHTLALYHTKTQVTAKVPPLYLRLAPDGTTLTRLSDDKGAVVRAYEALPATLGATARVEAVAEQYGLSVSSVWRALKLKPLATPPREPGP